VLEETKLIQIPSQHEVRPRSDLRLARINRPRPTTAIHRRKWIIISAIFAAAGVATGFVAGAATVDASPVSHSAMRTTISSTVAAHSTTHATTFPEANRAAKGNRATFG
jgi:NO-binding membrane sensor protein with MHYT domain